MTASHAPRRGKERREDGAIAVISALVSVVLLVVAAFTVDIGSTWARRGQLQLQADNAALFAAESLPVSSTATRAKVVRMAAYYIACHPVPGQKQLTTIPDCPAAPSVPSPTLDTFANHLSATGMVTFPAANQVRVTTPPARIDYSFGPVAGVDDSIQQKSATARVSSPGYLEPIGLSLTCLLSAAGNLPSDVGSTLSGVLPMNYMAPGPLTVEQSQNKWPNSEARSTALRIDTMTPNQVTQGVNTAFTLVGSGWVAGDVRLSFLLGDASDPSQTTRYTRVDQDYVGTAGSISGPALPTTVVNKPGTWAVKVGVRGADGTYTYAQTPYSFTVTLPQVTADLLGCGRMLKSPRNKTDDDQSGTKRNLEHNMQEGLDHPVVQYPQLLSTSLPGPVTASSLLTALNGGVTQCSNTAPAVKDAGGSLVNGLTPNCMVYQNGSSTISEFTDGMLGAPTTRTLSDGTTKQVAGRLVCTTARPCQHDTISASSLGLSGSHQINDDEFEDYVDPARAGLVNEALFFNLSTFVDNGVPAVTPPKDVILPEIYRSHRFFWVPVLSTVLSPTPNANDAGAYPVLTFRPVFVTESHPSGVDSVDMVLDLVDLWVRTLLGIDAENDHGILMNGSQLRALRFMTIEPAALPMVPDDYTGPTSDYLGVGPKIVRLVK